AQAPLARHLLLAVRAPDDHLPGARALLDFLGARVVAVVRRLRRVDFDLDRFAGFRREPGAQRGEIVGLGLERAGKLRRGFELEQSRAAVDAERLAEIRQAGGENRVARWVVVEML